MNTISSESKPSSRPSRSGAHAAGDATPAEPVREISMESSPGPIRILLADSEAIFRVGMAKILALEKDLEVVAQTDSITQTLNAVAAAPLDVIFFESGV